MELNSLGNELLGLRDEGRGENGGREVRGQFEGHDTTRLANRKLMTGEIRAHLLKHGRQTPRATGKGWKLPVTTDFDSQFSRTMFIGPYDRIRSSE